MLLMIEIGLTIAAWRRGWRGWALLPVAIGVLAGFIIGSALSPEVSEGGIITIALVGDLVVIGMLVAMVAKGRKHATVDTPVTGVQVQRELEAKAIAVVEPTEHKSATVQGMRSNR